MMTVTKLKNQSKHAYSALEDDLRREILKGRLKEREAIRPESELAREYAISRNTARKALDHLVEEGLLYKIQGSGTFVTPAGRREFGQRMAAHPKSRQVLFMMLETVLSKESFAQGIGNFDVAFDGAGKILAAYGYNLLFAHVGLDWKPPACLSNDDVCGVLFHGTVAPAFWEKYLRKLPNVGLQYDNPDFRTNWVKIDNFSRSYQAMRYLKELGHRRIGFVSNEGDMQLPAERYAGYLEAARRLKLPTEPEWSIIWQRPLKNGILESEPLPVAFQVEFRRRVKLALRQSELPTAFVCLDDWRALWSGQVLAEMGYRTPDEVSLTGGFNQIRQCPGNFTGLKDRFAEVCGEGARILLELLDSKLAIPDKTVQLRPELVIGTSTAPPRA